MNKCNTVLLFESSCVVDDTIWISARDFNGLFKGNLKDGTVEFVGCFPDEDTIQKRIHYGEAIYYEEKIYFIPLEGRYIHAYNLRTLSFERYGEKKKNGWGYSKAVLHDDKIYMISTRTTQIIRFDLKSQTYEVVLEADSDEKCGYEIGIYVWQNVVFMMIFEKNILRCFDLEKNNSHDYSIEEDTKQYRILAGKENIVYLVDKEKAQVILWDAIDKKIKDKVVTQYAMKLNSWQLDNLVLTNSSYGDGITFVDMEYMKDNKFYLSDENVETKKYLFEIQNAFVYKRDIYFVWERDEAVYSLREKTKKFQFLLEDNVLDKVRNIIISGVELKRKQIIEENKVFQISEFLRCMKV